MLSKKVKKGGKDWDQQLLYVLFAYRASIQESTGESPFFCCMSVHPEYPLICYNHMLIEAWLIWMIMEMK